MVRFPGRVERAAPIAGTARATPYDVRYARTLVEAITSDPGFAGGEYTSHTEVEAGLRRHARLWGVMGPSTEFFQAGGLAHAGVRVWETFLEGFLEPTFTAMDPNDLLCMAWKWQHGDVARHTGGDLAEALGRNRALTYIGQVDRYLEELLGCDVEVRPDER